MKVIDDDGTEMVACDCCYSGRFMCECCDGSGGCSCRGGMVDMGDCRVCSGTGWRRPDANVRANADSIMGLMFLGSGPRGGYFGSGF